MATLPQSPIKGVERLSEELRLERQKVSQALQEKARQRVEIESYKQVIDQQKTDIKDLQQTIEDLNDSLQTTQHQVEACEDKEKLSAIELVQANNKIEELHVSYQDVCKLYEDSQHIIYEKDKLLTEMNIKLDTADKKALVKDELLQSLKDELLYIRQNQVIIEKDKTTAYERENEENAMKETIQSQSEVISTLELACQEARAANDDLRSALENNLQVNQQYTQQILLLQESVVEKESQDRLAADSYSEMKASHQELYTVTEALQKEYEELFARFTSELDGKEAALLKSDSFSQKMLFLEEQLTAIQSNYTEALTRNESLEQEILDQKRFISSLQSECSVYKEQAERVEALQEQVKSSEILSMELETMKNQITLMRKKLMKRDLEEETSMNMMSGGSGGRYSGGNHETMKAIIEREQQARLVHEGIIQDLRHEIDKLSSKYHDSQRKYEEAMITASKVTGLEEEIELYKEMARSITEESHTVALSAAETAERSMKAAQERHQMMQNLQRAESELHAVKKEMIRDQEEITNWKEKSKSFHQAKLIADKKSTEVIAMNSRLEAALEESKQQYDRLSLELAKSQRQQHDLEYQLQQLQVTLAEKEQLQLDYTQLKQHYEKLSTQTNQQEKAFQKQIDTLSYELSYSQQELTTVQQTCTQQKQMVDQLTIQQVHLQQEIDSLKSHRDRLLAEHALEEQQRNDDQVRSLQQDLTQTMKDWQSMEREQSMKDEVITTLQVDYGKEKEKAILLKMQMNVLEERLAVMTKELSVYRGINVYHASKQAELQSYNHSPAKKRGGNGSSYRGPEQHDEGEEERGQAVEGEEENEAEETDSPRYEQQQQVKRKGGGKGTLSKTPEVEGEEDEDDDDEEELKVSGRSRGDGGSATAYATNHLRTPGEASRLSLQDILGNNSNHRSSYRPSASASASAAVPISSSSSYFAPTALAASASYSSSSRRQQLSSSGYRALSPSPRATAATPNPAMGSGGANSYYARRGVVQPPYHTGSPSDGGYTTATDVEEMHRNEISRQKQQRRQQREQSMRDRIFANNNSSSNSWTASSSRGGGGLGGNSSSGYRSPDHHRGGSSNNSGYTTTNRPASTASSGRSAVANSNSNNNGSGGGGLSMSVNAKLDLERARKLLAM